jgi:hypothetical protein
MSVRIFEELATAVDAAWIGGAAEFPDIARAQLEAARLVGRVSGEDVLRWIAGADAIPKQVDLEAEFAQPPITVARRERFYVDVYFWVDGTTTIHQHSFSGAFAVLEGSSVHARWRWREERELGPGVVSGALELGEVELLAAGDVRAIENGAAFVHALYHLERPSVSVIVRTWEDPAPQRSFLPPRIAYDQVRRDERAVRARQVLELIDRTDGRVYEDVLSTILARAEPFEALEALRTALVHKDGIDGLAPFLPIVARRLGEETAEIFRAALACEARALPFVVRRKSVRDADHRMFLALLLYGPPRARIMELVAQRVPSRPALDTIAAWITALAPEGVFGFAADERMIEVVHALLYAGTIDGAIDRLRAIHGGVKLAPHVESLRALCVELRESLLGPILI